MVTVKYSNGVSVDHDYQYELKCFDHGKYMRSLFFYKYSGAKAWANGLFNDGITFKICKIKGNMCITA